jgi:hypothetical protein
MIRLTKTIIAVSVLGAVFMTGCYGRFALTRKIYDWNGRATGDKFVNTIILWGLIIIPVYEISLFLDFVLFNTIEFWGGSNPMAQVQPDGTVKFHHAGHDFHLRPASDGKVEVLRDGKPSIRYFRRGDSMVVTDTDGKTLKVIDVPKAMATAPGLTIL